MSNKQSLLLDDDELITKIVAQQAGWRDILSTLLQRHHNALLIRCYAYLKNHADAEDATQDTELRVYRAVRDFRGDSSFRTWLFAIADRQCYDIVSKRSRRMINDHLRALIEINESCVNKIVDADEPDTIVSLTLARLPEQERDVIMLRYYTELSLQDISVTLGIGLSATKMRLYRALEKFAALLDSEQGALNL